MPELVSYLGQLVICVSMLMFPFRIKMTKWNDLQAVLPGIAHQLFKQQFCETPALKFSIDLDMRYRLPPFF